MTAQRYCRLLLLMTLGLSSFGPLCFAQTQKPMTDVSKNCQDQGAQIKHCKEQRIEKGITTLTIDLQGAPEKKGDPNNSMEPVAEPTRFRVDDRATVQVVLRNLSPLDVCSLNGRTPSPTAETNVAEFLAATIAKLGAVSINFNPYPVLNSSNEGIKVASTPITREQKSDTNCKVLSDPEYQNILDSRTDFFRRASELVGEPVVPKPCRPTRKDQAELACEIDEANLRLLKYAGEDYRANLWNQFKPESEDLQSVRDLYAKSLPSIEDVGKLQAIVDEMTTWALDLHKKYDYKAPATGDNSQALPLIMLPIAGAPVVLATPTTLVFTYAAVNSPPKMQTVHVFGRGSGAKFTATQSANSDWLRLQVPTETLDTGTVDIKVTADPKGLTPDKTLDASIAISGTGQSAGTTIINVTVKLEPPPPSPCNLAGLLAVDEIVDRAKAVMSLLSDNNKTLEGAQASLKTNYMALVKVYRDFVHRRDDLKIISQDGTILAQKFNLGTDRKATITGNISCVSDIDGKTPTTDNINFSILYQNIPTWTASAGLLTSFLEKKIIGLVNEGNSGSTSSFFRVTDRAPVQLIPMAYVNYRLPFYGSQFIGKGKEDELVWTGHLSAGFGVNPNSGTNQPEFFLGFAIGLNRFMIHPGVHFGRTQSLGGGYTLNTPTSATSAPITWSYHLAFSIGFSVRLAPY